MSQQYEVVVVGGGPVGAMALVLLGHAGISAIGVERDPGMWPQARAVHFDGEIMRLLQSVGIAEKFSERSAPMREFRMENEAGETLLSVPTGQLGAQAWCDESLFHQPDLETLLRDEIDRLPTVELRSGATLVGIDQEGDEVRCSVRTGSGTDEVVSARWVVACDGAQSTVRRLLGVTTENLGTDDPWLVVDGHLSDTAGTPSGDMVFFGCHTRPALWIRMPNGRVRMEFKLMPGDDREEICTPQGIARLSKGVLTPENFTCERSVIYTFRARVATDWQIGRVFLAGDAAHQAPPLFGQGLCSGLRDVANLVWKLRLVALGKASPELLDTYQPERRAHARYWVQKAADMAGLVQTTDPVVAERRDAHLRADPTASRPPVPPLGPGLHTGTAGGGYLSVQPLLADGRRLDDLVGTRFLVAARSDMLEGLDLGVRALIGSADEITVLTAPEETEALLAAAGAPAVVVRPDRYVLGTAQDAAALQALLATLPMARSGTLLQQGVAADLSRT
ncbi:bifunctional 3-(3-hydroxy-phenyl)propionate/3-hydroxycinnamic acid hydroxylase [Streptomyces sp. NPDC002623]